MAKINTTTNNFNKEEMIMKKLMEAYYAAGNNEDRAHTMYVMLDQIEVLRVKKDIVVELAKQFGMETKKSTTKAAAMTYIQHKANELVGATEQAQDSQEQVTDVSVGDLDITKDNAPQQEVSEADIEADNAEQIEIHELNHGVQQVYEKKAKTDKMFALIKACAADNNKKGYGFTISSFMLQACILNAGAGVEKFKGHTVTEEESELLNRVYHWLFDKGFVKPVVYAVKEDTNVRVYMPEYTGKTKGTSVKMIPYNKSAGYTASKITSFMVCC